MRHGLFAPLSPFFKLVIIILLVLIGSILASTFSLLLAQVIFEVDIFSLESMEQNIPFMQAMQIMQSIMIFIIPSAAAAYLLYEQSEVIIPGEGKYDTKPFILLIILAFTAIFVSQGFIAWTAWLNQSLQLPETWAVVSEWIKAAEDQAMHLTKIMLQTSSWQHSLITIFMIAVLPAIGEEWLFRGLIQKELGKAFKNIHLAIFVTAIIFSAVHMQFLTFLPRLVLGIILGYLMVFSRNIWIPIAAHFFNNFLAVALFWYYSQSNNENLALESPTENPMDIGVFISLIILVGILFAIKQIGRYNSRNSDESIH